MVYIVFIIFDFITHKQLYSSNHFTGSSRVVPIILKILAIINIILLFGFLIIVSSVISFWHAAGMIAVAECVKYILNRLIARRVNKRMQKQGWNINGDETDPDGSIFFSMYMRKCDVESTKIAVFGTLVNIGIVIFCVIGILGA